MPCAVPQPEHDEKRHAQQDADPHRGQDDPAPLPCFPLGSRLGGALLHLGEDVARGVGGAGDGRLAVGDRARADLRELAPHLLEAGGERARAVADRGDHAPDRARELAGEPVELGLDRAGALEQLRGGLLDSLHVGR
ncbi:MAG TPA: hypothetical protein VE780_06145, partial [Thermoleophilaceae bacterium]|nr:hypothetical protein [Thermoleophilaceae bacterium]